MSSHRLLRVNELLKRELGEILRREMPVEKAGLVSVNEVQVSGDLKLAKVFVSILGGREQEKEAARLLEQKRVRIQGLVGRSVVLRYTPQLSFVVDDSIARGDRVLRILDELEKTGLAGEKP